MYRTRRPFIIILTILTIVSVVGLIVTPAGARSGPNPVYSLADAQVYEGGVRGLTHLTFDLTASEAAGHDVTFLALTQPGTATRGGDFAALSYAPVVLKAGETAAVVRVQVLGDTVVEDDETLNLQLYRLDAGSIWQVHQATGTILDDDVKRATSLRS